MEKVGEGRRRSEKVGEGWIRSEKVGEGRKKDAGRRRNSKAPITRKAPSARLTVQGSKCKAPITRKAPSARLTVQGSKYKAPRGPYMGSFSEGP